MINLTSKKVLLSIGNLIAKNPIKLHYSCLKNIDNKLNSGNVFERRYLSNFVIKDVHEPSYLDYLQPQIPFFDLVNVQVKGYDFAVLENYAKYLHRLGNNLGINIKKCWPSPNTTKKIETLKHESIVVESTYQIDLYERNIQIEKISANLMCLLVDIVHRSLPAGVYLSIHEHNHFQHEYSRFIPDHDLAEYKKELNLLRKNTTFDEEDPVKKK